MGRPAAGPAGRAISAHRLRAAARVLRAGGVVAHATEGVWGLACDALNRAAVGHVLALKQRNMARGLIVIAASDDYLAPFVAPGAQRAWRRALGSWPGPTTWLLPAHPAAPRWLTGDHATIALRWTAHRDSAALCAAFGAALVSTSANISGRPPVRSAWQARARFGKAIDFVAGGAPDTPGRASAIRDATTGKTRRGR